ncbi:hypothetical protein KI387_038660 [Taxus chinensis]|uniref:Transposase n=1 Tax=Taxus chinensis TaxID=29808 RepID=A0AA38CDY8_TAXCH|nr:hypothetical protein KI387_038660 [Taxus chinensis]
MASIGRPKKDKKQLSLADAFGISRHSSQPCDSQNEEFDILAQEEHELDGAEFVEEEHPSKKPKRTFKAKWKTRFPWAYAIKDCNGVERIKCSWCVKYKRDTPFAKDGSTTLQASGLLTHAESEPHKFASQHLEGENKQSSIPITKHIELMVDAEKERIISVMENMYFVAIHDLSLELYKSICDLNRYKGTPHMPLTDEYSAYTNTTSGKEFLQAAKEVYWKKLKDEIFHSPFYSILVDESTDRTMEQHLIVYITYLTNGGRGQCVTKFIRLLEIKDGTAQAMYDVVITLLTEMNLSLMKLVGFGSDGASAMRGIREGLSTKLRRDAPHLLDIHCIAHREALATNDASSYFPELQFIDKFANKIYSWLGKSAKRHGALRELMDSFQINRLEVLQIHQIRWLSRGKVMERLVKLMFALLKEWELEEKKYVLTELNKLNKIFQEDHIDITSIGTTLDITIDMLRRRFQRGIFGAGTLHTSSFLTRAQGGSLEFADGTGTLHVHALRFESLPKSQRSGTLDDCIELGKSFIVKVIDSLDTRFTDLPIFNAAKFFSPRNYYEETEDRDHQTKRWLTSLCDKFSVGNSPIVDSVKCLGEMDEFICTIYRSYPKKHMFGAWDLCGGEPEWFEGFPCLMQLWQAILVIPASTAVCERGFSKLNRIKNDDRSRLSLSTLDMLMFLSLCAPHALNEVDWNAIYDAWKNKKARKPLPLDK